MLDTFSGVEKPRCTSLALKFVDCGLWRSVIICEGLSAEDRMSCGAETRRGKTLGTSASDKLDSD